MSLSISLRMRMFTRLMVRSATVRRGRTLTALLAMVIAAAVATALLNLYVDLDSKLTSEFRKFGANVVVVARDGSSLPADTIARASRSLRPGDISVPFAYAVAKTSSGKPVVVAGTDFDGARKLNSWWSVTAWPSVPHSALVGERASEVLESEDRPGTLTFSGRALMVPRAGVLRTGGAEDSRVYLPLADFTAWTGVTPSTLELAIQGAPGEVTAAMQRIRSAIADINVEVRPVRQIVEAETRVLGKTRSILFFSTIVIAVMVALCVLATLTASVLERRRDYAVMKALGSSQQMVSAIFLSESMLIGVTGAVAGFAVGCGLAAWIGRVNFHAAVVPRLNVFPAVFVGCVLIALVSAMVPLSILQKLEPAVMLKGD